MKELIEGFQELDELFEYAHNIIYDEHIIDEYPDYIKMFEQNIRDIIERESKLVNDPISYNKALEQ